MFERFTDRSRRVVVLADEEARMLNHQNIGTEHILLGLIREGEGVAARALESLGIFHKEVWEQVEEIIGKGQTAPTGHITFTTRAKRTLELSLREALQLGHTHIGPEHILLGLIREGEGRACQVLQNLAADSSRVRAQVIQLLAGGQHQTGTHSSADEGKLDELSETAQLLLEAARREAAAAGELVVDAEHIIRVSLRMAAEFVAPGVVDNEETLAQEYQDEEARAEAAKLRIEEPRQQVRRELRKAILRKLAEGL